MLAVVMGFAVPEKFVILLPNFRYLWYLTRVCWPRLAVVGFVGADEVVETIVGLICVSSKTLNLNMLSYRR